MNSKLYYSVTNKERSELFQNPFSLVHESKSYISLEHKNQILWVTIAQFLGIGYIQDVLDRLVELLT